MDKLSKSELEETKNRLGSLSDDQLGQEIYDDWQGFEPTPGQENAQAEAEVYRRLSTMLVKPRRWRHRLILCAEVAAVALIVILFAGSAYLYSRYHNIGSLSTNVVTAAADRATVNLPDGSTVELNGNSSLGYALSGFNSDTRRIEFQGEGYFDIVKNKSSRFIIESYGLEVTVHGTSFNLSAREGDGYASLYLVDGAVSMKSTVTGKNVTLEPEQKATLIYATGDIEVSSIDYNDNPLAWKSRRLMFRNATLATVVSRMEEYYGCEFVLDSTLVSERFTGMIPLDNIELATAVVEKTFNTSLPRSSR